MVNAVSGYRRRLCVEYQQAPSRRVFWCQLHREHAGLRIDAPSVAEPRRAVVEGRCHEPCATATQVLVAAGMKWPEMRMSASPAGCLPGYRVMRALPLAHAQQAYRDYMETDLGAEPGSYELAPKPRRWAW